MENASKALLMAGGILVGMLILALFVTLATSAKELSARYDTEKKVEVIQKFNVNFLKYTGKNDLTIHQVITITNFANENGVMVLGELNKFDIASNIQKKYKLQVLHYNSEGYIDQIEITESSH